MSQRTNGAIKHYEHCIAKLICNPPQPKCFMRTCKECPKVKDFKKYLTNVLKKVAPGDIVEAEEECDTLEVEDVKEIEDMLEEGDENENGDHSQDWEEDVSGDECDEVSESEDEESGDDDLGQNEEVIHFRQWTSTDRCEFKHFDMRVAEFVNFFSEKLEKLVTHVFISERQTSYLNELKHTLKVGEFIVWGDFSENFSFVLQNEAQGYYWSKKQATIHPFIIYHKNDKNELDHINYVVISDCLKHDSASVHLFITKLVKFLEGKFQVIKKLYYFSDGCAGQYKNRKNFANVYFHKADFGYDCEWHFHATSHGKGPCDGLGGTLKRCATRVSLARHFENQIDTAELLFQWAASSDIDMNFEYATNTEYESMTEKLKNRFDSAVTIKGTLKYHCFIPKQSGQIMVKKYSTDYDHKMVKIVQN